MNEIERIPNNSGQIERFGATQKIDDVLGRNFEDRGKQAANLLVATLTESPYKPQFGDRGFAIPVHNIYKGGGDDSEKTTDTVVEAREALAEFMGARVPGSRRTGLQIFGTHYNSMLRKVRPSVTTPTKYHQLFNDALVDHSRACGIEVATPHQAMQIIRRAPSFLRILRLGGYQGVTEDGHMVSMASHMALFSARDVYGLPREINRRGGKAPSSRIVGEIESTIVHSRTKRSSR